MASSASRGLLLGLVVGATTLLGTTLLGLSTPAQASAATSKWLGLHYTAEELAIWRRRAQVGPYKTRDDVVQNSPGSWDRIAANAQRFLANPAAVRHVQKDSSGQPVTTCVQKNAPEPVMSDTAGSSLLRDAAFYYLITGETAYRDAVKAELLWQAREPTTDFSNRAIWCPGVIYDINPSFALAHWQTKLLHAYDYLGRASFTATELQLLDRWHYQAANFWRMDLNKSFDALFVDRWNGNYTRSSFILTHDGCGSGKTAYYGSKPICAMARYYNNRKLANTRYVGLVAIYLHQHGFTAATDMSLADLKKTAKLVVKEFVKYSVYPEGFVGDFERWTATLPDLGWGYGMTTVGPALTLADAFARAGDTELYEYETHEGYYGTEAPEGSPAKSLRFALRALARYIDDTYERYGTASSSGLVREFRIDSYNEATNWYALHDVAIMPPANIYYRDLYLQSTYLRKGPNRPGYPLRVATSAGGQTPWVGEGAIFPGVLFMWGQLEDQIWPY